MEVHKFIARGKTMGLDVTEQNIIYRATEISAQDSALISIKILCHRKCIPVGKIALSLIRKYHILKGIKLNALDKRLCITVFSNSRERRDS